MGWCALIVFLYEKSFFDLHNVPDGVVVARSEVCSA